jgi:hypothetical protein
MPPSGPTWLACKPVEPVVPLDDPLHAASK